MKIEAVRLADVGRFREPVSIEGLTGAFDVLAGPNEAGKSTLFRALKTLFTVAHNSKDQKRIGVLRPYDGGAPTIECEFVVAGRRWRLVKRYLSAPYVELHDLGSHKHWKGADAENRLTQLLNGPNGPGTFLPLLWVDQSDSFVQRESLARRKTDLDGHQLLGRSLEGVIEAASGASRLNDVAARIELALSEHVTVKVAKPVTNSDYAKVIQDVERLRAAVAEAHDLAARSAAARGELIDARERMSVLIAPATVAERGRLVETTGADLDAAREAQQALKKAEAERTAATEVANARRQELKRLVDDVQALASAEQRIAAASVGLNALEVQFQTAKLARSSAESKLQVALARSTAARAEFQRIAVDRKVAKYRETLKEARLAARSVADFKATIDRCRIDERSARDLVETRETIIVNERAIAAEAGSITIAYERDCADVISVDGVPIRQGGHIALDRPLTLVIADVGTVVIEPGGGALAERRRLLEAARQKLSNGLLQVGAATIDDALAQLERRRECEAGLREAEFALRTSAPDGLTQLEGKERALVREQATAAASAGAAVAALAGDNDFEITATLDDEGVALLGQQADEARREFGVAEKNCTTLEVRIASASATLEAEEHQQQARAALLPPVHERSVKVELFTAQLAAADEALELAALEVRALRARLPNLEAMTGLERANAAAIAARKAAESEHLRLRELIARLEATLARDDADGVGARAEDLEQQLTAANRRLAAFRLEVESLQLLRDEVRRAGEAHRKAVVAPVAKHLERLAEHVLAKTRFSLGDGFKIERITRAGRAEQVDSLSGGTHEQISVLAQLAYARLLADTGHPVPLVLDDALVYADDQRLASLLEVLAEAGRVHQVIMLTCHEQRVASLAKQHGGVLHRMVAWQRVAA